MTNNSTNSIGHIYVLSSPNSDCIKIGGTNFPPLKRIKEINACEPYKSLGPWTLIDFRQVKDWKAIESAIHYTFRSKLNKDIPSQKELFAIASSKASAYLNKIDPEKIITKPKVDRLFQDLEFTNYIIRLFKFTALINHLDIQGAWTFTLFPGTGCGRYFTINIGSHEVAFSTLPEHNEPPIHMILMDKLILDFEIVKKWLRKFNGEIKLDAYKSALPRSAAVFFESSLEDAKCFLQLDGVRRALIAYWFEALVKLKEKGSLSIFQRYHNWNAIARIHSMITSELP
jgi:hypothetical protein